MSELKQRYAINMKNKMVVACTSETLPSEESAGNIHFKEIDISVAIAIRDGKITADEVIRQIQAKVGVPSYSEMMDGMKHLNVREKDIGLESAVKGEVAPGNAEPVDIQIPGSGGGEKTAAEKEAAAKRRAEAKARKEAEAKAAEEEKARKEAEEKARREAEERAAAALEGTGGSGDMPTGDGQDGGEGGARNANL